MGLTHKVSAGVGFGVGGYTNVTNAHERDMGALSVTTSRPPSFGANSLSRDPKFHYSPLPDGIVHKHVDIDTLELYLQGHPEPNIVKYVLTGLRAGFDLGYNGARTNISRNNNKSARDNPVEVTKAIHKELARGHTAGPFPFPPFPVNHISPLGAAPKPDGSYRLVLDLSQPDGQSINDGASVKKNSQQNTHILTEPQTW